MKFESRDVAQKETSKQSEPVWMSRLKKVGGKAMSSVALLALAEVAQACAPVSRDLHAEMPKAPSAELSHRVDSEKSVEKVSPLKMVGWEQTGVADSEIQSAVLSHFPESWKNLEEFRLKTPNHGDTYTVDATHQKNGRVAISIVDIPANEDTDNDRDYAWVLRDAPARALALSHEPAVGDGYTAEQRTELTARAQQILQAKKHPQFVEMDTKDLGGDPSARESHLFMARLLSIGVGFTGSEQIKTDAEWRSALARDFVTTYGSDPHVADDCVKWIVDALQAENPGFEPWKANRERRSAVTTLAHQMQETTWESGAHPTGALKDVSQALTQADFSHVASQKKVMAFDALEIPGLSDEAGQVLQHWERVVEQSVLHHQMDAGSIPMRISSEYPVTSASVEKSLHALSPREATQVTQAIKMWTAKTLTHMQKL